MADLSRRLGRGGGSVIGGRAILALDPDALAHLVGDRVVALVSGTNGKTTTTSLLGAAMATAGPLTTNVLGANQPPGLAAALAAGPRGGSAVLEVDEAWMERVAPATRPAVVLLLNLSRDQLDRNNEVRQLAARWRRTFTGGEASGAGTGGEASGAGAAGEGIAARADTLVVANADDPLVAWSALGAPRVCWVGAGQPWTEDAAGCPSCGSRVIFEATAPTEAADGPHGDTPAGGWHCTGCGLQRPALDVWLEGEEVVTADGWRGRLDLALPGRANRANAAMALAGARHLGVPPETALEAMAGATEIVGRYATVETDGVQARLLLAKNPAGWLEVLDVLKPAPSPVVVAINARIADGRDPSWLWDVPFERLAGRLVIASGERGRDLAVRLHYAEVEHRLVLDPVEAVHAAGQAALDLRRAAAAAEPTLVASDPQSPAEIARAAARRAREEAGLPDPDDAAPVAIDAVGNYTTFQALRTRLAR